MTTNGPLFDLPLAATMDLQYRLPPFQQVIFSPTIAISLGLIVVALALIIYFYRKGKAEELRKKRREDLQLARKLLTKRGGSDEDFIKMDHVFASHPKIDPAASIMIQDVFQARLFPVLKQTYGGEFALRMQKIYFPPPKDTNAIAREKNLKKLVENTKNVAETRAVAAMIDLMDATLKPGAVLRMSFDGVESGCECLVMNHNMQCLNITLPANRSKLIEMIRPGTLAEGNFESGPSLMAFTSTVLSVMSGSMPFCRLSVWKNAWEVRKRESVRLAITLEIDFQHISTASAAAIKMSQLEKEIGAVRPGRLIDLSLGGGGIETPSDYAFNIGDFVRFTASLIPGHPAATLLGAIVDVRLIHEPEKNDGMKQHLGVHFLALDDVSQRLLARAMRQLQETASREEWLKAQSLLEQMRRNNVQDVFTSSNQNTQPNPRPTGRATSVKPNPGKTSPAAGADPTRSGDHAAPSESTRSKPL